MLALEQVKGKNVPSCPKLECTDEDYATDTDDWCVKINYDEALPAQTTVRTRECLGKTKYFCNWGKPG